MKNYVKYCLLALLIFSLLFFSCSDSDGSSGAFDVDSASLVSSWSCTVTHSGNTYQENYTYYLYSNSIFAYRIIASVDSMNSTVANYSGTWSTYGGTQGHTYYFKYDVGSDSYVDLWGTVSSSGSSMTVYTTENKTTTDSNGATVSSQFPDTTHIFSKN